MFLQLLTLSLLAFNINCQNKFPRYVGVGYDVLYGNPLVDKVDPGFRGNVFDLTYDDGDRTEDGLFLVPDRMIARTRRSCTYTAQVTEFRGTTSYQKDLKTLAEISTSTPIILIETSFSSSTAYTQMQDTTTENNQTVMNSGAKCEAYSLEMDRFDPPNIGRGFRNAIHGASNDPSIWSDLIQQYGTHYVRNGVFGGRMTLQQSIERKKLQQLEAMGVDVKTTASLSFGKLSGSTNVEVGEQQKKLNAYESRLEQTKELYIGGKPPQSSNWMDWYDTVLAAPMPTSYSINSLAELLTIFNFPEFSNTELTRLKNEFNAAFDAYCKNRGCRVPTPDALLPPPAISIPKYSQVFNGWMFNNETIDFKDPVPENPFMIARQVIVSLDPSGSHILGLRFHLSDGINSHYTAMRGVENNSNLKTWPSTDLSEGEYITQIDIIWGYFKYANDPDKLLGLRFYTNKRSESPLFGVSNGYKFTHTTIQLDGNLVGIRGFFNPNVFYTLGFISTVAEYP